MRILLVHNRYQQHGGEDVVVERESALLKEAGHELIEYHRSNDEVNAWKWWKKTTIPMRMIWASDSLRQIRDIISDARPDIAHFHNTHFMISPAAYRACRQAGVPVVQSLYNPRLMCPAASFYRQGELCQDCLGKTVPWPSVIHGCYRQSRLLSAVMTFALSFHRLLHTWDRMVDRFIVATDFYRHLYIQGGLPAGKLCIKPHFVRPDPGQRPATTAGEYALFVGRLDAEKGVRTLLEAWHELDIPLRVRGDGQLRDRVLDAARRSEAIELVGRLSHQELLRTMKGARFLVWPSEGYYETFGLVAIEAFACGVPVLASKIGVMAEIVKDGDSGIHFRPGRAHDLAEKARWAWDHPDEMVRMGHNARRKYEERYTAERNYEMLMAIYDRALQSSSARRRDTYPQRPRV